LHQLALGAIAPALQSNGVETDIVLGGPYFNRGAEDVDTVGATDAVFTNQALTDIMVMFHDDRESGNMAVDELELVVTFAKGANR
jgi:hypothetical protein